MDGPLNTPSSGTNRYADQQLAFLQEQAQLKVTDVRPAHWADRWCEAGPAGFTDGVTTTECQLLGPVLAAGAPGVGAATFAAAAGRPGGG